MPANYLFNSDDPAQRQTAAALGYNSLGTATNAYVPAGSNVRATPNTTYVTMGSDSQVDQNGLPATYIANGRLYYAVNDQLVPQDTPGIEAMYRAAANEDARRFEVGQGNIVANRQLTAQEHADQVAQAKAALDENRRQYDLNLGQRQSEFGTNTALDTLKFGATLRGPLRFVEGDAFAQGVSNSGLSPWIASLRTGQPVQYGGATATQGNPTPLTVGTLANAMSGGGGSGAPPTATGVGSVARPASVDAYGRPSLSPDVQTAVDAGSQAFQSGLANKPLGWYEGMSGAQQQGLNSIGSYLGRNVDEETQYYKRSRPGNGNAMAA